MKIQNNLPQFSRHSSLILVLGTRSADFYHAAYGHIYKLDSIAIPADEYLNIDAYQRHPGGFKSIFGSGSVYHAKERTMTTHFLKQLKEKTDDLLREGTIQMLYLLVPEYMKNSVKDTLKINTNRIGQYTLVGNYSNRRPLEILTVIRDEMAKQTAPSLPEKEEARKILQKTQAARSVLGE